MPWRPFQEGATIGHEGSEQGVILKDEEHSQGARVTLERTDNGPASHAITCGVGGMFVHTCFQQSAAESQSCFDQIKMAIDGVLALMPAADSSDLGAFGPAIDAISALVAKF